MQRSGLVARIFVLDRSIAIRRRRRASIASKKPSPIAIARRRHLSKTATATSSFIAIPMERRQSQIVAKIRRETRRQFVRSGGMRTTAFACSKTIDAMPKPSAKSVCASIRNLEQRKTFPMSSI